MSTRKALANITPDLPRANDKVEILNSTVISVICKIVNDEPNKLFENVSKVQLGINSTHQKSLNNTRI